MSATKDKVIDDMNVHGDFKKYPRAKLIRSLENALDVLGTRNARLTEAQSQLLEARERIAKLDETGSDLMNGQSVLAKSLEDAQATIAAHEKTIADLEARAKALDQWVGIAHEMAKNNTRLTTTLDNMAKAAAGLVPPAVMQSVNR